MTEIKPFMCSCCNDIWNRENQKNIKLGKHELHLCPDCYREYIISNNKVFDKIRAEIEETKDKIFCTDGERQGLDVALGIIDKYRNEVNE